MAEAVREVLSRVEKLRLRDLQPAILSRMSEELGRREEELSESIIARERSLQEALEKGDYSEAKRYRLEIRQLGREHEEMGEEHGRLFDALQESLLMQAMVARLGSRQRVWMLEWVVFGLIVLVLSLLALEFLTPDLPLEVRRRIFWTDTACCVLFLFDFFFRLRCADSRSWFWRRHWVDFITSIPLPDAQLLRFGRAARLARVMRLARVARFIRLLRFVRLLMFFWRGMDKLREVLDMKLFRRSLLIGVLILLGGAWTIWMLEGSNDPEVGSFGQSVWWSFTTVVTGGFGDIYNPVTPTGRVLTVFLIIAGMIVVGVFTATLTAILVGDESEQLTVMQLSLEDRLEALDAKVERLMKQRSDCGRCRCGGGCCRCRWRVLPLGVAGVAVGAGKGGPCRWGWRVLPL